LVASWATLDFVGWIESSPDFVGCLRPRRTNLHVAGAIYKYETQQRSISKRATLKAGEYFFLRKPNSYTLRVLPHLHRTSCVKPYIKDIRTGEIPNKKDDFKGKSYWMTTRDYTPGEPLQEDIDVDVAIVGGGFTGLSSAYHIKQAEPINEIGWQNRQDIEDARNLVHYYRLTVDNRLVMGGRDVSLSYGNDMERDLNPHTFDGLKNKFDLSGRHGFRL
jgi:hypothetical protein